MTLPEILLWQRLRGSPQGIAFRKQHPIGICKADFYCAAAKLVVEVDGDLHNRGDQPERDGERDRFMRKQGYEILRIPAATILMNADEAASSVVAYAASPLHHRAARGGPPPRPGEDLA